MSQLQRRVDALRLRIATTGLLRALCGAVATFALVLAAGALPTIWLSAEQGVYPVSGALAVGLVAALCVGVKFWRMARPWRSRAEVTSLLAGDDAGLRDLLVSGEDLSVWGDEGARERGASEVLVRAQVEAANRALPDRVPKGVDIPALAGPGLLAVVTLICAALLFAYGPSGYRKGWSTLFTGGDNPVVGVGNLHVTYAPPAYTGLEPSEESGAEGDVRGYPGSRVTLEGQLSYEVDSGVWYGPSGLEIPLEFDGEEGASPGATEGRSFRVSWILTEAGGYRFAFVTREKPAPNDFGERRVQLQEDIPPTAELITPQADLETMGTEEVEVSFRAEDDFILERAELVLQGAEEVRLPFRSAEGKEMQGEMTFLPAAHPQLGEGAYLRVDVWDNDTISGPKVGSSRSVYIAFMSRGRMQAELEGLEERLIEAMLFYLADLLEWPRPDTEKAERLRTGGTDLLKLMDALIKRAAQGEEAGLFGAAAVMKIEAGLRRHVERFLHEGGPAAAGLVAELERDILFLDELLRDLRMDQVLSMGDKLAALQRDLFDRLAEGEDIEQLQEAVNLIEKMLQQMMQKLQMDSGELPDSFANADAVREPPKDSLAQLLEELREALKQGDREKAAELAEKVMEALSAWMNELEQAAGESLSAEMDPTMEKMQELAAEVSEAMAEQERILSETREVSEAASRERAEQLQAQLDEFLRRQEERLRQISNASIGLERLVPHSSAHGRPGQDSGGMERARKMMEARGQVNQGVRELRQSLRSELGSALPRAKALEEAITRMGGETAGLVSEDKKKGEQASQLSQAGTEAAQAIVADLESLLGGEAPQLSEEGQQRSRELAGEQGELGERIGQIAEGLGELQGQSPFIGPELGQAAGKAGQSSGQAGERLGAPDPRGAMPPEAQTLEHLSELAQGLEQSQQQMMEQQGSGQRGGKRGHGEGGQEVDRSRVEIPAEAEARQWRAFREEVLKAMREGRYPEEYEREVERYYERLIR